jgi:hypothetical protein
MSKLVTRLQHASPERKYLMRRRLMRWLHGIDGAAYCPFAGHLDIALGGVPGAQRDERYPFPGLYADRTVYGADLDPDRVKVAVGRVSHGIVRVADCDRWVFPDVDTGPIVVADFDAWTEPWPSFRSFWQHAEKGERIVCFWTDAHRMGIAVDGTLIRPDGSKERFRPGVDRHKRSAAFNFYLAKIVWPWLTDYVNPYRILDRGFYLRGMLTYYGAVLER